MRILAGAVIACTLALTAHAQEQTPQRTTVQPKVATPLTRAPVAQPVQTQAPATRTPAQTTPAQTTPLQTAPLRRAIVTPLQQALAIGPVTVPANAGWVRTGAVLRSGGEMQNTAREGSWSLGKAAGVTAAAQLGGATGFPDAVVRGLPLPSANAGALIGRIGDGAPFLVGARFSGPITASGELSLSINDAAAQLRDNQGGVLVLIRAAPPTREPAPPQETPGADAPPRNPPTTTPPSTTPPSTTAPPTRTPPTRTPPVDRPPAADPPTRTPPQDTTPPTPPTRDTPRPDTPVPPVPETSPAPVDDVQPEPPPTPVETPATPVTPTTPELPAPPETPVTPAIPWTPIAIGGALLAGVLLLGSLIRPRRKPDNARGAAAPHITTRVVSDGIAGQSLTITTETRR